MPWSWLSDWLIASNKLSRTNVRKISTIVGMIGPAIGFVMGGSLLSLHTDLVRKPFTFCLESFHFQLSGFISWLDPSLFSLGWCLVAGLPPHLCRIHPQCPRPPVLPRQHQPEERHHSGQQGEGGKAQTSTSSYLGSCDQPNIHFCEHDFK